MFKELKYVLYVIVIFLFIFLTGKYYFSDENKKNFYRSFNNINEKINIYSSSLPLLKNNTNNVVLDHKQIIWSVAKRDDKENNRDDYEFTKFNKLYNKVSNTSSSILHINGWRDWYKELYDDKR